MTNRGKQLQALLEAVFFIVIVGLDPTIQRFRTTSQTLIVMDKKEKGGGVKSPAF